MEECKRKAAENKNNEDSNSEMSVPKRNAVSQCTKHRKHLTNMKNPSEIVKCLSLNDFIYL